MDIINKSDYDKYEIGGFKLNQKVLFKGTKESRILAMDLSDDDTFKFFVKDKEGEECGNLIECCGVRKVFDKKGTWCRKEDISPIIKPVIFDVSERLKEGLSNCEEDNREKARYFQYKDRVSFVKAADGHELRFYDDNGLVEVEKEKDAEAIVVRFHNTGSEIEDFLRMIMFLNPCRYYSILECIISAQISSISKTTDDLLEALIDANLIEDYRGSYYKAVLISI